MTDGGPAKRRARGRASAPPKADPKLVEALQPLVLPQTWLVPAPRGTARGAGGLTSHVGGRPYKGAAGAWPECSQCDRPLTFLGELALDVGPHLRIVSARLASVFVCGFCIGDLSPEEPPGRYQVWLHEDVDPQGETLAPPDDEPYPVRPCRLRAVEGRCLPLGDVLDAMAPAAGRELDGAPDGVAEATWRALIGAHFHGSVVGGYGLPWDETEEPPACPSCDRPQSFLAAIHGADCEPHEGDTGAIGHDEVACLTVCPNHPGGVRLTLERYGEGPSDGDGGGGG
jgi:hypothetical protein